MTAVFAASPAMPHPVSQGVPDMPQTRRVGLMLVLALGLFAAGCARALPNQQAQTRVYAAEGSFDQAAQLMNEMYGSRLADDINPKSGEAWGEERIRDRHALVWSLDRGILATLAGDYQRAFRLLSEASALVEEFRTFWSAGNVTRQVGAVTVNETVARYEGVAHEHVHVEFWRSFNELLQAQRLAGIFAGIAPGSRADADQHYQNAVSFARRMVLNQIVEAQDAADSSIWRKTYYDDPFARMYSAALMLSLPRGQRTSGDAQFAQVMLRHAWRTYAEERDEMRRRVERGILRYEVVDREQNQTLLTLMHRVGNAYDPVGWAQSVERFNIPLPESTAEGAARPGDLPPGHGSILIMNKADFIALPRVLELYATMGTLPGRYTRVRHGQETVRDFRIGAIGFAARGPGAEIVDTWGVIPVPEQVTRALAPGGAAVMGTQIPVHQRDAPIGQPVRATVVSAEGASQQVTLQVVCDLDAYARATLKDEQPVVLMRALIRTAIKQTAAALAANEARKQNAVLGAVVGLAGSVAMTMTEVADLRASILLPNTIQTALIDVPAGEHQVVLQWGQESLDLGSIRVPAGQLVIVPARTFPTFNPTAEFTP